MAEPNSVKIVEVCRVAPQAVSLDLPTPDDHSLPLTFFDLLWLRFEPVQRIFFYELSSSINTQLNFLDSILPKLKTSLSITLQHFLPLAGNLSWPQNSHKPILKYAKGDTVSLTIAESSADFSSLSRNDFVEAKQYHPFVPQLAISPEKAAVLALQITLFPNRGFSIGTAIHHAALDGKTSTMFVKSWAHICKQHASSSSSSSSSSSNSLLPDQLKPFYDRRVLQDPNGLTEIYSDQYQNMGGPNNRSLMSDHLLTSPVVVPDLIRGTFEFTQANIQTLRRSVMTALAKKKHEGDPSRVHLSTFSLACAYSWVCLVKAEEIKPGGKTAVIFAVDSRSRLDPPIPSTYFGNCLLGRKAVAETQGLLGEDGLVVALNAITEAIKSLEDGLLKGAEFWFSKFLDFNQIDRVFSIAGSHRFEIYDTDFGWGRPKRTEVVSIDKTGAISLSDSRNGGGSVDIGVVLKKHEMQVFASLFAKGLQFDEDFSTV